MDWVDLFLGAWAVAATGLALRYRWFAKHALELAQDSLNGWKATVQHLEIANKMLRDLEPPDITGLEIITGARPAERKDLVN